MTGIYLRRVLFLLVFCSLFSRAAAQPDYQYEYDDLGRLIEVRYGDGAVSDYAYDAPGNRTQVIQGGWPEASDDVLIASGTTPSIIDPRTNDVDLNGDELTVVGKTDGTLGFVNIVSGGAEIQYTANNNVSGTDSFTYTVSDGGLTDTATVNVTINAVNQAPTAVNDSITPSEDTQLTFDPRTNDSDPESQALTIVSKTNGSKGAVAILGGGKQLQYTPNSNVNGADSFTYTISDGSLTDTATVNVSITPVNDAPNAANDSISTNEDTQKTFDPRGNDTDIEGQTLTITGKTNGSKGTVAILGGGTQLRYNPNSNANGSDSFTYTISDGSLTDTATVTVSISAVNDAPSAGNDSISTNQNTAKTFDPRGNDNDVDSGTLTITSRTNGSKGAVAIVNSGTRLRYTPNTNAYGSDSFTYTISDGSLTDTATVSVTINRQPNAVTDYVNVTPNVWNNLHPLLNDTDPDGHSLTITGVTPPNIGNVLIVNSTTVKYKCGPGCSASNANFTYTISDGHGGADTGTVNVEISGGGGLPGF